jgi:secondary thiamine-phosphate synthase enzyme
MHRLAIKTHKKREVIDITQKLEAVLWKQYEDKSGICQLSLLHTTAALTTADLDPGTDLDMLDAFELMVPKLDYRHEHNPEHLPDHILSAMIGTTVSLMVESGLLLLGTWQRVVLIEFDGPRERELVMALAETVGT